MFPNVTVYTKQKTVMNKITTVLLTLITLNVFGQGGSKIGTESPDLEFSRILNFKNPSAKLSDFGSKVVLIDFWATWCAPCIASFPHLEELQKKFSADLQVITITGESEDRIKKFLEKRKVNLPIVIDAKRELENYFPHRTVSHTVIIDKDGIIRAITTPSEVSEEIIKKVISNEPISILEKKDVMDFDPSKPLSGNENFTYQITVTPYQEGVPSMSNATGGKGGYANRRIFATNLSAQSLYEIAYQFPTSIRTVVEVKDRTAFDWNKQNAICFDLIVPENKGEQRFEIMQQQLDVLFNYEVKVEDRIKPVKVLRIIHGEKAKLIPSNGEEKISSYSGNGLSMKNSESRIIADFLAIQFNKPVVDKTGLSGLYSVELNWFNENPDQIHQELKKFGLELVDEELKIEVLVISDKIN